MKRKSTKGTQKEEKKYTPKKKLTTSEQGIMRTGGYYGRYNNPLGNSEKKFFDTAKALTTVANTGTILNSSLNLIVQGATESNRVGRKVVLRNIYFHGSVSLPATNVDSETSEIIRVIVYCDKQTNGAAATVTDILKDADYRSFRNLANQERFVILKDKFYDLNASCQSTVTAQTTGDFGYHIKMYKKLDIPLEFSGATGAITELKSNNIGIMAISEAGVGEINYICRVRYSD